MINENMRLLNEANSLFIQKKFDKRFIFILICSYQIFQRTKSIILYALFCDISIEDEIKAISLFDYFTV